MIIKLLCRYTTTPENKLTTEMEDHLRTQELIKGDAFNRDAELNKLTKKNKQYEYGEFVFSIKDCRTFNAVDPTHTCVRMYNGDAFTFKIAFEDFVAVYQNLSGQLILDLTNTIPHKAINNGNFKG